MRHLVRRGVVVIVCLFMGGALASSGRLVARCLHTAAASAAPLSSTGIRVQGRQASTARRIETTLTYTSLDAPGAGEASAPMVWDDSWFERDETEYNHELARAASVLSALAYSESGHYQNPAEVPAYMEHALSALGFSEVDTGSYRFRSEVVDEVLNLVTDDADAVAYTVARKRVSGASDDCASGESPAGHREGGDGVMAFGSSSIAPRDVIVVSIRGSYGSEWVSNLDLSRDEEDDHGGYVRAAHEVVSRLESMIASSHLEGSDVSVLLVGHSRGGAVANLVAAELDGRRAHAVASRDRVYAYTFASPATTLNRAAHDERYANIFNIINPADIMPSLPLRAWGYERYGVDLTLPSEGAPGHTSLDARMRSEYERSVGVVCAADSGDARVVKEVISDISARVGSADDLVTPRGAAAVLRATALRVNPARLLHSHYPSTYICWMQVVEEGDLGMTAWELG